MRTTIIGLTLAFLVTASAAAQQPPAAAPDARWQPWIGCWQLLDESVRGEADLSAEQAAAGLPTRPRRVDTATRVCVAPAARGVTLTTLVGATKALEETIVADGSSQPIVDSECRGTTRSEWSKTAPRLYSAADISCGDQAARKISSLSMMMTGPTWVDIQLIDIDGRKNIRIRRLQRVDDPMLRTRAAFVTESAWTVDDVKEAATKLAPETVQAALVELNSGFNLKSRHLLDLDRAGVPDEIVDLMIALSYPKKFVIERPVSTAAPPLGYGYGYGIFDAYGPMWPFYMDAMFWPSYYSPFAYRYWGSFDPYYFPGSGYVVIAPPAGPAAPVASGEGRVIDGRGYTRVSTRQPDPIQVNGVGGNNGSMAGGSSSSGGGSNTGSSGVSSGGYSGGGGDTGRTAVPRPPGL